MGVSPAIAMMAGLEWLGGQHDPENSRRGWLTQGELKGAASICFFQGRDRLRRSLDVDHPVAGVFLGSQK